MTFSGRELGGGIARRTPAGHQGMPDDVSEVAFLAGDEHRGGPAPDLVTGRPGAAGLGKLPVRNGPPHWVLPTDLLLRDPLQR